MDRMNIVTGVAHAQPVSLPLLQMKCGWRWFASHGIRHTIDRPPVEAFFCSVVFCECHLKSLISWRSRRVESCKACIAPFECRRSCPLRLSGATRVLHDDSHTVSAITVVEIA